MNAFKKALWLVILLLPTLAQGDELTFSFSGSVKAGELFQHDLSHGLSFRLVPSTHGWSVTVGRQGDDSGSDFAAVTLPLHGINATQLEGWHFRNADNTGPNDSSVNAPQERRDFNFTTTQADYDRVMAYYDCLMRNGDGCSQPGVMRWGTATLTVTDYELDALAKGQQAAFKRLSFSVTGSITETDRIFP